MKYNKEQMFAFKQTVDTGVLAMIQGDLLYDKLVVTRQALQVSCRMLSDQLNQKLPQDFENFTYLQVRDLFIKLGHMLPELI